jgi:hypothetical protein
MQKVTGLVNVLMEVLEKYTTDVSSLEQAAKPDIFTGPRAFPLVLTLAVRRSNHSLSPVVSFLWKHEGQGHAHWKRWSLFQERHRQASLTSTTATIDSIIKISLASNSP